MWIFFGWGAGGAGNMSIIIAVLSELGFEKVSVIFDSDKADEQKNLNKTILITTFK